MADNAAVASLLAALTQRAQKQPSNDIPTAQNSSSYLHLSPPAQQAAPQYSNQPTNATAAAIAAVAAAFQPPVSSTHQNLTAPFDVANIKPDRTGYISIGPNEKRPYDDKYNEDFRGRDRDRRGRGEDDRKRRRSQSPPRLQDHQRWGPCSPRRDYSPGGSRTDSIVVKTPFVGLIIGRGGENLKMIEHHSGARVQFITNGKEGPERVCNITGRADQVSYAKDMVIRMIDDAVLDDRGKPLQNGIGEAVKEKQRAAWTAEPDAKSLQIMVPERTVGFIIGRGGETVRDIQDQSRCHVSVSPESQSVMGLRPINLNGSPESTAIAKKLIDDIVESDKTRETAKTVISYD
ncbi:hypothetical protein V1514DRAFT_296558 [Lipomyces japonicus]|uniref:uncharacterized protein n=1 Tax=Lipomyces japonicus TaxID=56871 RepID=UPI0034CF1919